jgi:DNA invertase Pin-like site-specific DNA recombinase
LSHSWRAYELATTVANSFHALQEEMRQGFQQLTSRLEKEETTLGQHATVLVDHSQRLDRIERKFDNTIERVDEHRVRLEWLEKAKY